MEDKLKCEHCGYTPAHPTREACIDRLRDVIADYQMERERFLGSLNGWRFKRIQVIEEYAKTLVKSLSAYEAVAPIEDIIKQERAKAKTDEVYDTENGRELMRQYEGISDIKPGVVTLEPDPQLGLFAMEEAA